jgi:acylglycerol lipase
MLQSKNPNKEYNVTHDEFSWKSVDGQDLFAQSWDAGSDCLGGIVLVHGMGEHSSRYDRWAGSLAANGFSVLAFDLRGHGKTPGIPGGNSNYNILLNDIDLLVENARVQFKDKPLFLYGHSFGGNLVANYVISRKTVFAGIILTSPWLELSEMPPRYRIVIATILNFFIPGKRAESGLKTEYISRELKEVHKYRSDKLVHGKITVGLFVKAIEHGLIAKRSIYKINSPLLLLHGTADSITSCKASREFVMNSSDKTTFIEIEGGYHELHNDSDRQKVFDSLIGWLNKQVTS